MIYLGSDHAGFKLKQQIIKYLENIKEPYEDLGNLKSEKGDDYPEYGYRVAKAVTAKKGAKGILICGTSYGMCIIANKVKGSRAVSVKNVQDVINVRKHNNANIICLSGWDTSITKVKNMVKKFLTAKFDDLPRRRRRINKIKQIENKEFK